MSILNSIFFKKILNIWKFESTFERWKLLNELTFLEVFRTTSSFTIHHLGVCMIFNQPKIETVPTIDICWFTSKFSLTKLFRHYEASFMDWELRHSQIDQRYIPSSKMYFWAQRLHLPTTYFFRGSVQVQPSLESVSDEKIIDTKFLQIYHYYY